MLEWVNRLLQLNLFNKKKELSIPLYRLIHHVNGNE